MIMNRPVPAAKFSPNAGDRHASVEFPPQVAEPIGGYFPEWLISDRRIPRPVALARDAEATAREAAVAAARRLSAARREALAADRAEEREAARNGVSPDLQAKADRAAEVSRLAAEHREAGRSHKLTLQALIDAWEEHYDRIRELTATICAKAHADAVKAAEALDAALTTREAAYARIGRPGADTIGKRPDIPGAPDGAIYWASRRNGSLRSDGLDQRLSLVREATLGFPAEAVGVAR